MNAEDERRERYLWDPAAPPDPEVQALEERLASARFDKRRHPLALPARPSRGRVRLQAAGALAVAARAAAAGAVIAPGLAAYWSWRWTWTPGASWAAEIDNAADHTAFKTTLAVDQPLELQRATSARVDIARIGTMKVSPGSALT